MNNFSGWYRDCGFIPHTNDVDFYIKADEFVEDFEKAFINDPESPLLREIGVHSYGHEMTFHVKYGSQKIQTDFFYLYENNLTTQWSSVLDDFATLERAM